MNTALNEWFSSLQTDQAEVAKVDFAVMIDRAIRDKKWSRKQFAEAVNATPAWVTKVLRGDVNLTIETMAKLCSALGQELYISMTRPVDVTRSDSTVSSVIYAAARFNSSFEIKLQQSTFNGNDSEYVNAA